MLCKRRCITLFAKFPACRFPPRALPSLLRSLSLYPLPCPDVVPMAKASENKVVKMPVKATYAHKAAPSPAQNVASKPVYSEEVIAKVQEPVCKRLSAR